MGSTKFIMQSFGLGDGVPKIPKSVLKAEFGGKGASLIEMTALGLPVPPGVVISTDASKAFNVLDNDVDRDAFVTELVKIVMAQAIPVLEAHFGYVPLLSVRSGAPVSMPGMMDTILNVGLSVHTLHEWEVRIGAEPALDSFRRLVEMMGSTAYGIPDHVWELPSKKTSLDKVAAYVNAFKMSCGSPFPSDLAIQLGACCRAVLQSWNNERAIEYRNLNGLDHEMGTAITIQAMVFGNGMGTSGSGVLFTRDPSTGAREIVAEYLQNAQGEDVVAGTATPAKLHINQDNQVVPWIAELAKHCATLETHYRDMVDVEFTVQDSKLYVLQSRPGKRTGKAAFRIAHDLAKELVIDPDAMFRRLKPSDLLAATRPTILPGFKTPPHAQGLPASPGVVQGVPVFSKEEALACPVPCILVRPETDPDDLAGMHKAVGILTMTGGITSHAAVVARAMQKPCITGLDSLMFSAGPNGLGGDMSVFLPAGPNGEMHALHACSFITIDGTSGNVWVDVPVPVSGASDDIYVEAVLAKAIDIRGSARAVIAIDPVSEVPQRLMLAAIWDNKPAWSECLTSLLVMNDEQRHSVTIDLTSPEGFRHPDDSVLRHSFTEVSPIGMGSFYGHVCNQLQENHDDLAGLALIMPTGFAPPAWATKFRIAKPAHNMEDLINPTFAPLLTEEAKEGIFGSEAAYQTVMNALHGAGIKTKMLSPAEPAEFAALSLMTG